MELGVRELLPVVCKMMSLVSVYEKRWVFSSDSQRSLWSPLSQVWAGWEKFHFNVLRLRYWELSKEGWRPSEGQHDDLALGNGQPEHGH